jgi:hypothetical protein
MQTLYERLSDKKKTLLLEEMNKHPHITSRLMSALKEKENIYDLTLDEADDLNMILNLSFNINPIYRCFEP